MSSRGPRWSAIRSNSAALSESAQCRSSKTMTAGGSPTRSATIAQAGVQALDRAAGRVGQRGQQLLVDLGAAVDGVQQHLVRRASEPGSAWPTSTTVSAGTVASSSCTSRVLPMPGSPAMIATAGRRDAASCASWRSSRSRPIITGLAPPRMVRTRKG